MIGVGDAGCDSGACSEVAGDGCWRADSGANADGDDNHGIAYDETRMVVKLAMLTAPTEGDMMTVRPYHNGRYQSACAMASSKVWEPDVGVQLVAPMPMVTITMVLLTMVEGWW